MPMPDDDRSLPTPEDYLTDADFESESDWLQSDYVGVMFDNQGQIVLLVDLDDDRMHAVRIGDIQAGLLADVLNKVVRG